MKKTFILLLSLTSIQLYIFPCFGAAPEEVLAESPKTVIIADIDYVNLSYPLRRQDIKLIDGTTDPQSPEDSRDTYTLRNLVRIIFFDPLNQQFTDSYGRPTPSSSIFYFALSITERDGHCISACPPSGMRIERWFDIVPYLEGGTLRLNLDFSQFQGQVGSISKVVRIGTLFNVINHPLHPLARLDVASPQDTTSSRVLYASLKAEDPFPSRQALDFLTKYKTRRKSGELKWFFAFYDPLEPMPVLKRIAQDKSYFFSKDSGAIGEIAADITMQWLGFSKLNAKYSGDVKGFDGAFVKTIGGRKVLILSESKFHARTPCLETILKKELCATITERLEHIRRYGSDQQKRVGIFIETFFATHPEAVYLTPYVIIADGKIKALTISWKDTYTMIDPSVSQRVDMKGAADTPLATSASAREAVKRQALDWVEGNGEDEVAYVRFIMETLGVSLEELASASQ